MVPVGMNGSRVFTANAMISKRARTTPRAGEIVRHPLFLNAKETVYGFLKIGIGFGSEYCFLYCYFRIVRLCEPQEKSGCNLYPGFLPLSKILADFSH